MNFFPATLTDVGVRLPFGEVTLTQEALDSIASHPTPKNVIVGVRPEQFEDAALIDGYQRIRALTFDVTVDLVESLGADKYVYFTTAGTARAPSSWPSWPPNPVRAPMISSRECRPTRPRPRARRSPWHSSRPRSWCSTPTPE